MAASRHDVVNSFFKCSSLARSPLYQSVVLSGSHCGHAGQAGSQSARAPREREPIAAGGRVRVLQGRRFEHFQGGDRGGVLRVDAEAGTCEVVFDGRTDTTCVAVRHLEAEPPSFADPGDATPDRHEECAGDKATHIDIERLCTSPSPHRDNPARTDSPEGPTPETSAETCELPDARHAPSGVAQVGGPAEMAPVPAEAPAAAAAATPAVDLMSLHAAASALRGGPPCEAGQRAGGLQEARDGAETARGEPGCPERIRCPRGGERRSSCEASLKLEQARADEKHVEGVSPSASYHSLVERHAGAGSSCASYHSFVERHDGAGLCPQTSGQAIPAYQDAYLSFGARLNTQDERLSLLDERITMLGQKVTALAETVTQHAAPQAHDTMSMQIAITKLGSDFDSLATRLNSVVADMTTTGHLGKFLRLQKNTEKEMTSQWEQRFEGLTARVDALTQNGMVRDARMNTLEKQILSQTEQLQRRSSDIVEVEEWISRATAAAHEASQEKDKVAQAIGGLQSRLDDLAKELSAEAHLREKAILHVTEALKAREAEPHAQLPHLCAKLPASQEPLAVQAEAALGARQQDVPIFVQPRRTSTMAQWRKNFMPDAVVEGTAQHGAQLQPSLQDDGAAAVFATSPMGMPMTWCGSASVPSAGIGFDVSQEGCTNFRHPNFDVSQDGHFNAMQQVPMCFTPSTPTAMHDLLSPRLQLTQPEPLMPLLSPRTVLVPPQSFQPATPVTLQGCPSVELPWSPSMPNLPSMQFGLQH